MLGIDLTENLAQFLSDGHMQHVKCKKQVLIELVDTLVIKCLKLRSAKCNKTN